MGSVKYAKCWRTSGDDTGQIRGLSLNNLRPEDQLMVQGLRSFRYNHNLRKLENEEPQAFHTLRGFVLLIRYLRGNLAPENLRTVLMIIERFNREGYYFSLGIPISQVSNICVQEYNTRDCPVIGVDTYPMPWLRAVEDWLAKRILDQIWWDSRRPWYGGPITFENPHTPVSGENSWWTERPVNGTVYAMLTEDVRAWRGSCWKEIRDIARVVLTRKEDYKQSPKQQWSVKIDPFMVSLRHGIVCDIWYQKDLCDLDSRKVDCIYPGSFVRGRFSPIPVEALLSCPREWDSNNTCTLTEDMQRLSFKRGDEEEWKDQRWQRKDPRPVKTPLDDLL